ncbi:hypothetical protein [Streptomyces beijiangensis]|uniref:Uncharacterized protein n=1 Tax=Streptomyces beijiangensis TaxID=163361 RepID=A0A939F8B1_9ACTN|nr:hypothetical protein [Streptomyces beijiangensis]MBO0514461.1 hypothetical protein [Streptomyces beijiangensis]
MNTMAADNSGRTQLWAVRAVQAVSLMLFALAIFGVLPPLSLLVPVALVVVTELVQRTTAVRRA